MEKIISGFERIAEINKQYSITNNTLYKIIDDLKQQRSFVCVMGKNNSDKNAIINTLITGKKNMPEGISASNLPVITEIKYGENIIKTLEENSKNIDISYFNNQQNILKTKAVSVGTEIAYLKNFPKTTLVNFPEFENESNLDDVTNNYISKSIAYIFIMSQNSTLSNTEKLILNQIKLTPNILMLVMVTNFDGEEISKSALNSVKNNFNEFSEININYCFPKYRFNQVNNITEFLNEVNKNYIKLTRKKYSNILLKELELLKIYVSTRINRKNSHIFNLDSDCGIYKNIDITINKIYAENSLPDNIRQIKNSIKTDPNESLSIKTILKLHQNTEISKSKLKVDLTDIENIINNKLYSVLQEKDSKIYLNNINEEYSRLKNFIVHEELRHKNIVALGGSKFSGKTSFINAVTENKIIPPNDEPFKSKPVYVIYGANPKIEASNIFGDKAEIDETLYNFKDSHLINDIYVTTPKQFLKYLVFLDIPYNTLKENIKKFNTSNFILWFIKSEEKNIPQNDIDYLKLLNQSIPKIFIITNCQNLTEEEITEMKENINKNLINNEISKIGIFACDIAQKEEFDMERIEKQLDRINSPKKEELDFNKKFKTEFINCNQRFEAILNNEKKHLYNIKKSISLAKMDKVKQKLLTSSAETEKRKNDIQKSIIELKLIQHEFFKTVRLIADKIEIDMPDFSEMEIIKSNSLDPKKILPNLRKKYFINPKNNYRNFINSNFIYTNPSINKYTKSSLFYVLEKCPTNVSQIKLTNIYQNSLEYTKMNDQNEIKKILEEKNMKDANAIRNYFKSLLGMRYPIKEHPIRYEDEYIKDLYIKMLYIIIMCAKEQSDAQTIFLQRIIAGINVKENIRDYFKKAVVADEDFAAEFIKVFSLNNLSNIFIVDSLIMAYIDGKFDDNQIEFISELCDMLCIKKDELEYLSNIAVSILEQNDKKYQLISKNIPNNINNKLFFGYLKSFFSGCLLKTSEEIYYYSNEKSKVNLSHEDFTAYGVDKIKFENIIIDISNISPYFEMFSSFEFINCDIIIGGKTGIKFGEGGNVVVKDCNFKGYNGFNSPIFMFEGVINNVIIDNCDFTNCGVDANYQEELGAVFGFSSRAGNVVIQNSHFTKCNLKSVRDFHHSGAVGYINANVITLKNNTFTECQCSSGQLFYIPSGKIFKENNRAFGEGAKLSVC